MTSYLYSIVTLDLGVTAVELNKLTKLADYNPQEQQRHEISIKRQPLYATKTLISNRATQTTSKTSAFNISKKLECYRSNGRQFTSPHSMCMNSHTCHEATSTKIDHINSSLLFTQGCVRLVKAMSALRAADVISLRAYYYAWFRTRSVVKNSKPSAFCFSKKRPDSSSNLSVS